MAILNIKNFPDDLYSALKERARRSHRSVSQEVVHLVSRAVSEPDATSILDLEGLGRELWTGMDAAEHVKKERDAWD